MKSQIYEPNSDTCIWDGASSGESTHLPPMWPGFDSQSWRHMWVNEFVVGSHPCSKKSFSDTSVFPSPQKPTFLIPIRSGECPHTEKHIILIILSWNYAPYKFTNLYIFYNEEKIHIDVGESWLHLHGPTSIH